MINPDELFNVTEKIQNVVLRYGGKSFLTAGLTREEIFGLFQGQKPTIENVEKLSQALGVSLELMLKSITYTWK